MKRVVLVLIIVGIPSLVAFMVFALRSRPTSSSGGRGPVDGADAVELAVAIDHGCARLSDGRVACVGVDSHGQVSPGREGRVEEQPVLVDGIDDARTLAIASSLSCALRASEELWCWGGEGDVRPGEAAGEGPWLVPEATAVTAFDVSRHQVYFARREVALGGWPRPAPEGQREVRALTVGASRACAVEGRGGVRCWTYRGREQHGPVAVPGVDDAVDVALGSDEGYVVHRGGTLSRFRWRRDEPPTVTAVPSAGEGLVDVAASGRHVCALTRAGEVRCAERTFAGWSTWAEQPALSGAERLSADALIFCATRGDARPSCWNVRVDEASSYAESLLEHL